jgi:hypothetical protein
VDLHSAMLADVGYFRAHGFSRVSGYYNDLFPVEDC